MEKLVLLIIGVLSSTTIMAQDCPAPEGIGACIVACTDNSNCTNGQICCSNGCGYECMTPIDPCATVLCAAPTCNELSPGTITPEGECCPVCACSATDGSMVAAGTSFMDDCNTCNCGSDGLAGCTRLACPPTTEPTTSTPTTTTTTTTTATATLPTSSPAVMCPNVTNLSGTCDEQCSGDDECSDGQLCCSNGCGHACMDTVLDCSAVSCLRPTCESPSVLVTPQGSCCPVCGCSTPDGEGAAPGESYHPDSCNTCTCTQGGIAACTLAFCPPPTDSTPTTDGTTVTPSVGPTDPTCPVGGQIRIECASPCNVTCANVDTLLICPTVCVINGCQCPRDTVIDEQSNTCVPRSDCPSSNTGQTCPAVQRTNEENCVNECSSNDDCQYERICCSNGCGGRVCSDSVEMCQLIQCAWPICEDGAQPAFSPFSCCPFCPTNTTTPPRPSGCIASDGTSVDVGETYMDQCNTCRCLEGGVGACTRRACIGCTLADGSWVAIGDTYKKDCNTCTCTDRDVDICTEIACNPGDQDTLGGAGATVFAGFITTLLCGLLSVLS